MSHYTSVFKFNLPFTSAHKGGLTSGEKRPDKKVQKEADVSSQIRIF